MPIYEYKALSQSGKQTRGITEAENAKAARARLKKNGLVVTSINEKMAQSERKASQRSAFSGRVSGKEIALMTRQLASLVKANIPVVEALNAVVEQTDIPNLKIILAQVRDDINEGLSLAKATAKHPKVFDSVFVNMIEAGESSGTLGLVLLKLADMKEAQMRLSGKVMNGMMYPGLMMGVSGILLIAIFVFVIPKITEIFEQMNKPIPPITQFLISFSDILTTYWYIMIAAAAFGGFSFFRYIKTETGKEWWHTFLLKLPVLGPLLRIIAVTRFASSMSTLLASGVPILTAMTIAKNLVGTVPIQKAINSARENITEGQSIAEPLKRSGEFPPMVIHMIAVGERTGELPSMLKNVAETYEEQASAKIDGLTSLLEPMMIIGMGGFVAFIVLSVFMPLMDMSNLQN